MTPSTPNRSIAVRTVLGLLALPVFLAAQGGFNGPGSYEIANLQSGKVLDLDRNDQSTVIQFSPRGTDNQAWEVQPARDGFFFIRNRMNGNALEAMGNNNSAPVRGVPFNGGPGQQWRIENGKDGNALIVNRSGKTLDIPDGTNRDGVRVQVYDLNGDANQRFVFRRVSGGGRDRGDRREGGGDRITCASDRGRRVYCEANTNRGVRLVRQVSSQGCIEGSTWGFDRRGIWVDRGCAGEFEVRR
jgi:hypothetical protein